MPYKLEKCVFHEKKAKIVAVLKEGSFREKFSFDFRPRIRFKASNELVEFLAKICECEVIMRNNNAELIFENNVHMKEGYAKICKLTNLRPVLLEPERQFMLLSGISFGKVFELDTELKASIIEEQCVEAASVCNEKITLKEHATRALENVFFLSFETLKNVELCRFKFNAIKVAENIVRNNIGFETVSESSKGSGMLDCSLVKVVFKKNAFFFNSKNPGFATLLHSLKRNKTARILRAKEFALPYMPAGPFYANETEKVPLIDAVHLQRKGDASIISLWKPLYIKNVKSSLSNTIKQILHAIETLEIQKNFLMKKLLANKKLSCFNDPELERLVEAKKKLESFLKIFLEMLFFKKFFASKKILLASFSNTASIELLESVKLIAKSY